MAGTTKDGSCKRRSCHEKCIQGSATAKNSKSKYLTGRISMTNNDVFKDDFLNNKF